jgi:PAS domain S-box-containing protein
VLWANEYVCRSIGFALSDVVGKTCLELGLVSPDHAERIGERLSNVVTTREPDEFEYVVSVGGTDQLIEYKLTPEFGPDGGVASILVVAFANDRVRRVRDALSKQTSLFYEFLNQLPIIAWLRDSDDRYVLANQKFLEHYGVPAESRIGKTLDEIWPADVAAMFRANDKRILESGRPHRVLETAPEPDGSARVWLNLKFPFTDSDGRVLIGGVGVDVTAEKRAEESRRQADAQLAVARRLDSLGMLAAGAAHDFNNLVTVILANARLASTELPPESTLARYLSEIEDAGLQAADLCRQMQAISGQGGSSPKPTDPCQIVREIARMVRTLIPGGVELATDLPDQAPLLHVDRGQLRQIVLNLLTNAIEAMANRKGRISVSVRECETPTDPTPTFFQSTIASAKQWVMLEVRDVGCGMSPETRARIFEPFFTTKLNGRGLGLPAVAGTVRAMRGVVFVESEQGVGTTLRIYFPVVSESNSGSAG